MFKALGWDIDNEQGYAEAYKEVVHEDAIKVGGKSRAPDYSFRGGTHKFFLEAKKPSVNIKDDLPSAFQIRRYAWSAKLPLSILTDFEELAVYDCRIQPNPTDKAATARIRYLKFSEYAENWDYLEGTFSRNAILKGSFDKYAIDTKSKRGTTEVDDAFLKEIEGWRDLLAKKHCPQKFRPNEARAEHRRSEDHRPHHLPANLRRPGHRAVQGAGRHRAGRECLQPPRIPLPAGR